jgi:hypothetical protein
MADLVTLAEVGTEMLDVACSRCTRRGRYRVAGLTERYGRDAAVRAIVPDLIAGCAKRDSVALHERCDVFFPLPPSTSSGRGP